MPEIHRDSRIGDIAAHDIRTADVFRRHGIDFCCHGRRTVADASAGVHVDAEHVLNELRSVAAEPDPGVDLTTVPADRLIARLVTRHHGYVRTYVPIIRAYLEKLARKHAERRPEMARLAAVFADVGEELLQHLDKEELILFPAIRRLAEGGRPPDALEQTLAVMEDEHEWVAAQLALMRTLAHDYEVPPERGATWRACYAALDQFEGDLHQQVHLENNVLFPMARRLAETPSHLMRPRDRDCARAGGCHG